MKARPQGSSSARARGLGPAVRVVLCGAMMLAVLFWLWVAGRIWMAVGGLAWWPTLQFVLGMAGQASLLGAFLMADDGRRALARRLAVGAALAFLLWLGVVDAAGLWPDVHAQPAGS